MGHSPRLLSKVFLSGCLANRKELARQEDKKKKRKRAGSPLCSDYQGGRTYSNKVQSLLSKTFVEDSFEKLESSV